MAEKTTSTFSLLTDTAQKLNSLANGTYLRWPGNVVDLAVSELWKSFQAGTHSELIKPDGNLVKDLDCVADG